VARDQEVGIGETMRRPRAILFDFGDTLLHTERMDYVGATADMFARANNPRGVPLERFVEALEDMRGDLDTRRTESLVEIPLQAYHRLLYERLGMSFDMSPTAVAWEFWRRAEVMSPAPGVHALLEKLASRHIPVAVVSNTIMPAEVIRSELARHHLDGFFRFIMASAEYGVRKPHPALFRTAAGKFDLPPADIWFVGDSLAADVAGAQGVGMVAVWYNHRGAGVPAAPVPDLTIGSLAELQEHVPR